MFLPCKKIQNEEREISLRFCSEIFYYEVFAEQKQNNRLDSTTNVVVSDDLAPSLKRSLKTTNDVQTNV
jgi:hypothetical protein